RAGPVPLDRRRHAHRRRLASRRGVMAFESLDYIYVPAPDFEAAVRFYTSALGGELRWRIRDGSTWVGAVRLAGVGPLVLLASHLDAGQTVLIYRVRQIEEVRRRLVDAGWEVDAPFE